MTLAARSFSLGHMTLLFDTYIVQPESHASVTQASHAVMREVPTALLCMLLVSCFDGFNGFLWLALSQLHPERDLFC